MVLHALGGDLRDESGIVLRFEGDQSDVRGVAFVAAAGMGNLP
jgi:hypothetical protein